MLKELKLSNFRLFDDKVTVRFRPITILIGQNNSGKSSIIKFLLMLKKSLDKESAQFFNTENTGLGNFIDLKNSLTEKKSFFFKLTVNTKKSLGYDLSSYIKEKFNQEDINEIIKLCCFTTLAETAYKKTEVIVEKHEAILSYDEKEQLVRSKYYLEQANLLDFSKEWREEQNNRNKHVHSVSLDTPKVKSAQQSEDLLNLEKQQNIEKQVIDILRENINSFYHLLPVRNIGNNPKGRPSFIYVGEDGRYTLDHLQTIRDSNTEQYDFILPHIQAVAGIDKIKFNKLEHISLCFGKNKVTGSETTIGSFGFGVSQCLPIFVQGVMMPKYSSLIVEEPEAQLHPTAQLELGSFFAALWNDRNVGSIIETHSENIILRLRRLISKGELQPEDVSIALFDFNKNEKKPVITNLDIEPDGSIQEGLPMEFFGKNLEEVLGIGAGE